MEINYVEMVDYFCDIINSISRVQNDITGWKYREKAEPSQELIKKAEKDSSDCYWSFDRAYYRARDVAELIDLKDEPDFASFALANLNNTKSRIEGFLKDAELDYPDYDLNKYDDILVDYYKSMHEYSGAVMKYVHIGYLRSAINLGLCHEIDNCYTLSAEKYFDDNVREVNYAILDEIVQLVKKLYGFKPPIDKKDYFVRYDRWNDDL